MSARVYNVCMLIGWLMLVAGGMWIHPGWGLAVGGVVLMALTALSAVMSAAPAQKADD